MDTSSTSPEPRGEVPWPSLLVLAGVTFVLVAGEMLPTAVLPYMAADLGVPVPQVGLLVSSWAAVVVVASFPLVRLTSRWGRRRTVSAALVLFASASLLTALAPSFAAALGSRLAAAAACGLLWATINAHTAAIVPERRLGRAVAVVLGGGTLGSVVAVPAANAAAQAWDWRGAFAVLAALGLAGAVAVALVVVPGAPGGTTAQPERPAGAGRGALLAVTAYAAAGAVLLAGHFAAFTFVTELLARSTADLATLLLAFGVASALGVVAAGRVADLRPGVLLLADATLLTVTMVALTGVGAWAGADLAVVLVWGLASGAVGPLAQTAIMRAAGPALRSLAGTTVPVAFNLGIAVGAAAGSGAVDRLGVSALPWLAGGVALLATLALSPAVRRRRDVSRPVAA